MRWKWSAAGALAAAVLVSMTLAHAEPAPGGEFDPNYPTSEVYAGVPRAAEQPPGPACAAARAYVGIAYGARFAEMSSLFAEDAVVYWPVRRADGVVIVQRIAGRAAIDAFYRNVIGRTRPYAIPVTLVGDNTDCMMQVAARVEIDGAERYRLAAINHFTVDASGKVIRLISFQRGAIPQPQ
jgi:hypothetical protein